MTFRGVLLGLLAAAGLSAAAAAEPASAPGEVARAAGSVKLRVNFQSCRRSRQEGSYACVFYGGPVKYYARQDAQTDVATFRPLHDTEPGAPMAVEGRVQERFGGTAELLLTRVSTRVADPKDRVLERLQGDWVSERDPADEFTITGSEREGRYAGLSIQTESIAVLDSCDGAAGRGPYLYAQDAEGGITLCYEIISASEDELLLNYLPQGRRLRYLRKR